MMTEIYEVKCLKKIEKNHTYEAVVPGSKSITNRALLIAAMADGTSVLNGCLASEDARYFLECLKTLGFPVKEESDGKLGRNITITGFGGNVPNKNAEIYVGSAGTAARFLVAMLAFSKGEYIVNSSEQMKKRPMQPLIDTLRAAGAFVECLEEEGHFPLKIKGVPEKELIPESFSVNIDKSSQFLSALMIAAGTFEKKAEIQVTGSHGLAYVDLTAEMMKFFGVTARKEVTSALQCMKQKASDEVYRSEMTGGQVRYLFSGEETYRNLNYDIEPDMSAAAYFYAAAAVLGTGMFVKGVTSEMLQGDTEFLHVLENMGCTVTENKEKNILVKGPEDGMLKGGFTIDMSTFSDQALTLAAIAPYADAPITITGIGHIRLQECDRIHAIASNLKALGIQAEEKENQVTIYPGKPHGCEIETFDDHRVAMSFALTGLRTEGVKILNPSCCKKTFAEYFQVLEETLQ